MEQSGLWFDGQVALERTVAVRQSSSWLILIDEGGVEHPIESSELVRLAAPIGKVKLGHRHIDGWRLLITEPVDPALEAALPKHFGSLAPSVSRRTMGLLIGISTLASALAAIVIFSPQTVADHMPMHWERRLGAAYDVPIDAMRCNDSAADAALRAILDRLDPQAQSDGFVIELLDVSEANAAALPGGRIVLFNGLFADVENPDALAGIVAHEIAHVRRRHVAAGMIRELGLSTVITLLGGGALATNAGGLASLKFTRAAEAEADGDAIAMLQSANIDPRPTAAAFEKFQKRQGNWPEWLASHPSSKGRAQQFAAAFRLDGKYRPTLNDAQARALMTACSR